MGGHSRSVNTHNFCMSVLARGSGGCRKNGSQVNECAVPGTPVRTWVPATR